MKQVPNEDLEEEKVFKRKILKRRIVAGVAGALTIFALAGGIGANVKELKDLKEEVNVYINETGILKGDEMYYPVKDISSIKYLQKELQVDYGDEEGKDIKLMKIARNGVEMKVSQDLISQFEDDFVWCANYLNGLFEFINPNIKFNIQVLGENEDTSFDSIQYHKYSENSKILGVTYSTKYQETKVLGKNWTFVNEKAPNITQNEVGFNFKSLNSIIFSENRYAFRYVLLHETLHALGLEIHLEKEEGGGMMTKYVSNTPLCVSPKELALLISYYGENGRIEEYNELLSWYAEKYNVANESVQFKNSIYETSHLPEVQVQAIEESIIDVGDFDSQIEK